MFPSENSGRISEEHFKLLTVFKVEKDSFCSK